MEMLAQRMAGTLHHRGPDGSGVWSCDQIALGHRRLSILDLSEAGTQPMTSHDDRWVISYNGEFYNFQDERALLEQHGFTFLGHSDTEVLVNMISRYGFERTLKRVVGMFAIAAWDREERKLYLGRDRFGQKPLYYGLQGSHFVFGSEIQVVRCLGTSPQLNLEGLAMMLRYKAVPSPYSVYQGIYKLPPASWTTYESSSGELGTVQEYWQLSTETPTADPCMDTLSHLFDQAVQSRMISDVPLGAFLSGGIDSTLTVSAMQRLSSRPVKTFTIGFADAGYDEAGHAAKVADYLGTEHTELRLTARDVLDTIPSIAAMYDEPFGDSSQVPTYLVSRLARKNVTVALSGDGGDEFFAGYNRHVWLPRMSRYLSYCPRPLREFSATMLDSKQLRSLLSFLSARKLLPVRLIDEKLNKIQFLLRCNGLQEMYRDLLSDWKEPSQLITGCRTKAAVNEFEPIPPGLPLLQRLLYADIKLYLPEDILTKVDRASMAVSLEARAPFLDHRLAEYALSIRPESKLRGSSGKLLLRQLLARQIPPELFERPKMGFAIPIADWLREDLQEWAQDLIHSSWTESGGLLNRQAILSTWQEHSTGSHNRHHELWNILMLLSWLETNSQPIQGS